MNKKKLKAIMIENGDNTTILAEYLGISRTTLSAKINGYRGADFNQKEIAMVIEKYNLTPESMASIFFEAKVS